MITTALHRMSQSGDMRRTIKRGDFRYALTTAPAVEPVTLSEAKLFARIDETDDDALVTALITSARQTVENQTGRSLIQQVWTAKLDSLPFATSFELAHGPLISIDSVQAYNEDGTSTALTVATDLILDTANARFSIKSTAASLSGDRMTDVFEVVYKAGYGSAAANVPEWAKTCIKQIVAHWYEHRETLVDGPALAEFNMHTRLLLDQNCVVEL